MRDPRVDLGSREVAHAAQREKALLELLACERAPRAQVGEDLGEPVGAAPAAGPRQHIVDGPQIEHPEDFRLLASPLEPAPIEDRREVEQRPRDARAADAVDRFDVAGKQRRARVRVDARKPPTRPPAR